MTIQQYSKFQELVTKLREIFQIDRPELDFGIYRILNARAGEVNDYLQNRLAEKVQAALSSGNQAACGQAVCEVQEKEAQYQVDALNPDTVPKMLELRQKAVPYGISSNEHENAVFSHLLTFFSRYYEQGDFISQRRYKGDTYAIPYAGEEVVLHWANKDQYYTKSGEHFSNYSFQLEDGRTVHFRLVAADTAKDNRKDNDKERRFALVLPKTVVRVDENRDTYQEKLLPVEEVSGSDGNKELIIRLEYAAQPKGTKQDELVNQAVETVLADAAVKAGWLDLGKRTPTEKNPQRTLLEKHLSDYTTKNTADYFIHKDLGGFLRRELDFYIKNEVMHLDDVQHAGVFADIEKNLRMIQCLRSIALDLITFLAQLEDFQKKLWLKKKFVVSSHYCITLDRVPENLYAEIAANQRQWEQWKTLGVWAGDVPGTAGDLKAAPYRMVDTSLFSSGFKNRILANIEDLEQFTNGLLVHGDNFHAIRLLSARYARSLDCIYIDPPYNTGPTEIIYKNCYRNSSWLTLMHNRIVPSLRLLKQDACYAIAIDDFEMPRLCETMDGVFDGYDRQMVVVNQHPQGGMSNNIARTHEYMLMFVPQGKDILRGRKKSGETEFRSFQLSGPGRNKSRAGRPNSFYAVLIDPAQNKIMGFEPPPIGTAYPTEKTMDGYERRYPLSPDGEEKVWCRSYESAVNGLSKGEIVLSENGALKLAVDTTDKRYSLMSNWTDSRYNAGPHGTALVANMMGDREAFSYPKSIHTVRDAIEAMTWHITDPVVMDFFAGSATTGHAVIHLNREDGGKRKFILVEMGQYFEDITKPRLIKSIAAEEWNSGVMRGLPSNLSHCFQVLKIESYEDTLNNLQLRRSSGQQDLLNQVQQSTREDYLLNYLLNVESRGSLLSVEDFRKPFDYQLNVAVDSAGAFEPRTVDLVETFNYLIGLCVKHIDAQPQRGFVTVTGTLPGGETCLVLWRDCDVLDYEGISQLCNKLAINPADNKFDVVYINGDHNIPTILTQTAAQGGATRVLKLRQIEPEFLERMFAVEDI